MINANELRIGNWVKHLGLDVRIEAHGIAMFEDGDFSCDPIPLTPEILEKSGFKKTNVFDYVKKPILLHDMTDTSFSHFETYWGKQEFFLNTVEYLHQLQNLYFALTGNELKITL